MGYAAAIVTSGMATGLAQGNKLTGSLDEYAGALAGAMLPSATRFLGLGDNSLTGSVPQACAPAPCRLLERCAHILTLAHVSLLHPQLPRCWGTCSF